LCSAAAGFSVAFVNYPGSTGFGQERIEMLSKDCGNLDVLAIRNARDHLVRLGLATTDKGKQHYDGGSHSGALAFHATSR
jgi:acylaminoacyl-peptidase